MKSWGGGGFINEWTTPIISPPFTLYSIGSFEDISYWNSIVKGGAVSGWKGHHNGDV